jgi:hypothetical protein
MDRIVGFRGVFACAYLHSGGDFPPVAGPPPLLSRLLGLVPTTHLRQRDKIPFCFNPLKNLHFNLCILL